MQAGCSVAEGQHSMTGPDGRPGDGFRLAVDLGTSHTVAMMRWPEGRARPLLFDGQPLLPSAVFLDTTGRLHVGRDALRLGYAEPGRFEPNPKRRVDEASVLLGDTEVPVADLFAALLGAVAREAVATTGFLPPTALTYPAAWGERRRAVLTEAVAKAGWPAETTFLPEPVAAARYFAEVLRRPVPVGSALAVFDFGGGTLDVAVVRNDGHGFTVAASGGLDDLGGLDLDSAVADHLGKSLAGAEPAAWTALTDPATLGQWRARRQFWEDVRGAKEMLSRTVLAPVPVPGVEHAVPLTRDEFEALATPLLHRGIAETAEVLAAAGVPPGELAGLFLVGGSSRVPLVARLLHSELGVAPTVLEQPELPVAEGALAGAVVPEQRQGSGQQGSGRQGSGQHGAPVPVGAEPESIAPHYEQGVAHAATPTPTPSTLPNNRPPPSSPPPSSAPVSPSPQYAEPVDPWATAEAAALAGSGGGGAGHAVFPGSPGPVTPPASESWLASAEPGQRRRSYRKKALVAAGLVVVLGLAAAAAVVFWPRDRALDFTPLTDAKRFAPAVAMTSKFADAEILGDRAYFASTDEAGTLGAVAVDTKTGKQVWSTPAAGVAVQWDHMIALPDGLAVFSATDTTTHQRRMVILGGDHGELRWERSLGDDDGVWFMADVVVVADRAQHRLLGLEVDNKGKTRWEIPDIKGDSSTSTAVIPATTSDDIIGPATASGSQLAPDTTDDTRIVQISADRSARVIDAKSGDIVVKPRQSVADPDDEVVAHNGRLIVRESENAQRIMSYDLGKLGEPDSVYTAPDTTRQLTHLVPCGPDRVCFVEAAGYEDKTDQVTSLDVVTGKRWARSLPSTETLVPVGDSVLAAQNTTPPRVSLLNAKGAVVWTREGAAARLNNANMLLFLKAGSDYPDDSFVWGDHVGDPAVPLGALQQVRSSTCSWDTAMLACVTDKDFVLQRFAK
jgi:molecular chaperone HscA